MAKNILIFNPDEMRADTMGHLGNRAGVTPNLDAMVQTDAVSFENAFCQNPVCVPSRCSFFSGLYPHVYGHRTQGHVIDGEFDSLLKQLKNAGYHVWMNDRNDFIRSASPEAFYENATTTYIGKNPTPAPSALTEKPVTWTPESFLIGPVKGEVDKDADSIRALNDFIRNRDGETPFCAFVGLHNPHPPYRVEEKYFNAVDPSLISPRVPTPEDWSKLPSMMKKLRDNMDLSLTEEDWKTMQRTYYAMVLKVDDLFGQVVATLKETGDYDDTDIYFLSDHGDYVGDFGIPEKNQNTMQDSLVRVPLIVKPHRGVPIVAGVREGLTELVDFYATVLDFAGVSSAHPHFGKSLKAALSDPSYEGREFVFCEGGRTREERQAMELLEHIAVCYRPRLHAQTDDICHTKATMIRSKRFKYVKRLYETDEFYDLANDPLEQENRIDDPQFEGERLKLQLAMLEWYQKTCDIVPFDDTGRDGKPELTLIERYVPEDRREDLLAKFRVGGYTLAEFEEECKQIGAEK